jgi:eukaryotic-like serine/threonine-protein kinase
MSAERPQPGSIIGGKFCVISQIGKGGMGVVYEAENLVTGKRVAIKWVQREAAVDGQSSERFLREARAAARIRHANVVDVYDVVRDGDTVFMVMELLEGEPFSALLARRETPAHALVALLLGAMRGVASAHKKHVIHRDIKPDNIFLARVDDSAQRTPKVVDFGISKLCDPDAQPLTRSNMPMGTPLYMSYEQLEAARDVDARTDVYGFGVILYEALTGSLPYQANTLTELICKILSAPPAAPRQLRPELPVAVEAIIVKAIAQDRDERYASLEALIEALTPFAAESAWVEASIASGPGPRQSTRARGVRWPALVTLGAVLGAGAGAALWLSQNASVQATEERIQALTALPLQQPSAAVTAANVSAPSGVAADVSHAPPSAARTEVANAAPSAPAEAAKPVATSEVTAATPTLPAPAPRRSVPVSNSRVVVAGAKTPVTPSAALATAVSSEAVRPAAALARETAVPSEPARPAVTPSAASPAEAPVPAVKQPTAQDAELRAGRPLLQEF